MTVDVLLARVGIGLGLIREKPVNELVRIQFGVDFCRLFRLFEFGIEEFGVVFCDGRFDSGGIIDEIIRFLRVDLTADLLRKAMSWEAYSYASEVILEHRNNANGGVCLGGGLRDESRWGGLGRKA